MEKVSLTMDTLEKYRSKINAVEREVTKVIEEE